MLLASKVLLPVTKFVPTTMKTPFVLMLVLNSKMYICTLKITTVGTGTNNSRLTSIKIHSDLNTAHVTDNGRAELKVVKDANTSVQIDVYTFTGTPSITYTSSICDYDPSIEARVVTSPRACK